MEARVEKIVNWIHFSTMFHHYPLSKTTDSYVIGWDKFLCIQCHVYITSTRTTFPFTYVRILLTSLISLCFCVFFVFFVWLFLLYCMNNKGPLDVSREMITVKFSNIYRKSSTVITILNTVLTKTRNDLQRPTTSKKWFETTYNEQEMTWNELQRARNAWNDLQRERNDLKRATASKKRPETTYNKQEMTWNNLEQERNDMKRLTENKKWPETIYNKQGSTWNNLHWTLT